MPLIIVCGRPASGKTVVSKEICEFMQLKGPTNVKILSDDSNVSFSRSVYKKPAKEREHQIFLKSEVQHFLSKDFLVICDSLNYSKGFRYELYALARQMNTTHCVVYCQSGEETCQWFNLQKNETERYEANDITELAKRFEEPDATNRWDSPLLTLKIDHNNGSCGIIYTWGKKNSSCELIQEHLPLDDMYGLLFEGKRLLVNLATQAAPVMPLNLLHDVDRITQDIIYSVIQQQRTALPGDLFTVQKCPLDHSKVLFTRYRTFAELSKLRRQFISYMKSHPTNDTSIIASLFVNFLNRNL